MTPAELIDRWGRVRLTITGQQGKLSRIYYDLNEVLKVIAFYEKQGDQVKVW